jgi:DNA-binding transcriptional LysR family regulator
MLDLEDLSTFVEVADAGGVTAAARRLGLPKSIVSRRLVRLEQDLGAQLLARTTRGAALTEAGASFREYAVVRPQGRFKADNGVALAAAALKGLGIAALPDFLVEEHIASGALEPVLLDYPPPELGLYVVRPPGEFAPRKVRALIDILVERFGQDPIQMR